MVLTHLGEALPPTAGATSSFSLPDSSLPCSADSAGATNSCAPKPFVLTSASHRCHSSPHLVAALRFGPAPVLRFSIDYATTATSTSIVQFFQIRSLAFRAFLLLPLSIEYD